MYSKKTLIVAAMILVGVFSGSSVFAYDGNDWNKPLPENSNMRAHRFMPKKMKEQRVEQREKFLSAHAELLNMSVEELKTKLENGEKMIDLVENAGFDKKEFREKMKEQGIQPRFKHKKPDMKKMKKQFENFVEKPHLDQEKANSWFERTKNRIFDWFRKPKTDRMNTAF